LFKKSTIIYSNKKKSYQYYLCVIFLNLQFWQKGDIIIQ
jgi:hypothetical protein